MNVKVVDVTEVPQGAKQAGSKAKASQALVSSLVPGKAARVEPEEGEALRGLKVSITRAAKALGIPVQITKGEDALYVQLAETAQGGK